MQALNAKQIQSLQHKIEIEDPLQGLSFNTPYYKTEKNITFQVLERYNYNMKVIYVIVALEIHEQFNDFDELKSVTNILCRTKDANFGRFGTCSFENDEASFMALAEQQIERLKK